MSEDQKKDRVPPGQALVTNLPVLHYGETWQLKKEEWSFKVFGLVESEIELTYDEFMALPKIKLECDIHCVTGWSRLDTTWEGIKSTAVRDIAKISPDAKFVMIHAAGGFTSNLPIDEFFDDDVIFATHFDGEPITAEHGAPVRLVVPKLYFWKSAKWVTGVEFMAEDEMGFWENYGYHNHGDPWKQERFGY